MYQIMFKRFSSALAVALAFLPIAGTALAGVKQIPPPSPAITAEQKTEVLAALRDQIETVAFVPNVDFKEWDGFLAKQKKEIDGAKTQLEFGGAVQKAFSSFGLSHIFLMTPQMVDSRIHHSVVGIGIGFAPDPKGLTVTRVFPDSAAATAGLQPGDLITAVEGKHPATVLLLRGEAGTQVGIEVVHPNGRTQRYEMTRKSYSIAENATISFPDKQTAVIRIPTFDLGYDTGQVEALFAQAAPYKSLVIDLRGNPGGAVLNLLHMLGLMLPPQTDIGTFVNRFNVKKYQETHPGLVDVVKVAESVPTSRRLKVSAQKVPYYKGTVGVLVNAGSGSAAEMAAAALHDLRSATVVGGKSAGAVLVSIIRDLPDGFKLQFPLSDYVTIGGEHLEGHGVVPDFVVKDPRIPGVDPDQPLNKAVAIIERIEKDHEALSAHS